MNKLDILKPALDARIQEVMGYQINIDNYTMAIEHIDAMSTTDQIELAEFRQKLIDLLATEKLEQKKAKVMLEVIKKQVGEL